MTFNYSLLKRKLNQIYKNLFTHPFTPVLISNVDCFIKMA